MPERVVGNDVNTGPEEGHGRCNLTPLGANIVEEVGVLWEGKFHAAVVPDTNLERACADDQLVVVGEDPIGEQVNRRECGRVISDTIDH